MESIRSGGDLMNPLHCPGRVTMEALAPCFLPPDFSRPGSILHVPFIRTDASYLIMEIFLERVL